MQLAHPATRLGRQRLMNGSNVWDCMGGQLQPACHTQRKKKHFATTIHTTYQYAAMPLSLIPPFQLMPAYRSRCARHISRCRLDPHAPALPAPTVQPWVHSTAMCRTVSPSLLCRDSTRDAISRVLRVFRMRSLRSSAAWCNSAAS